MSAPRPFTVTVYASSSERIPAAYRPIAEEVGQRIAARGWDLVWGGGKYGLMGDVSRGARNAGARTLGIILAQFLPNEVHCEQATSMEWVEDMRMRKRGLAEAGDAYLALPGGFGTMEELFEVLSFRQLGLHQRPIVVLNACDYWAPMLQMIERAQQQGFLQSSGQPSFLVAQTPREAIELLDAAASQLHR